ncbi:protoglobin domain-containing protein [Parerythrobacter aestuarii]|uniref:protoglobin domain-containing protein n=1 Tax=Parerythrobacter aestuarii TaxID=3020909 RepID=UPI0024DE62AB|nr:protoglobin domain-containing protein [Parerythrobacter aestuarii]
MTGRAELAERGMERLVEQRGDFTADVLASYYRRFPDVRAAFVEHGLGDTAELEARMVTATAYMLLQWASDRQSTMIEQGTTIGHHHDTLKVGPQWYMGLVDSMLEVLFATLPENAADERAMWLEIRAEVCAFVDSVRPEFWRTDTDGPLPQEFSPG